MLFGPSPFATVVLGNLGTLSAKIAIDFEWEKSRMCKFDVPKLQYRVLLRTCNNNRSFDYVHLRNELRVHELGGLH